MDEGDLTEENYTSEQTFSTLSPGDREREREKERGRETDRREMVR